MYTVNEKGFYGEFGGAFIPEMLYGNVEELRNCYPVSYTHLTLPTSDLV